MPGRTYKKKQEPQLIPRQSHFKKTPTPTAQTKQPLPG